MTDELLKALARLQRAVTGVGGDPMESAAETISRPFGAAERERILAGALARLSTPSAEVTPLLRRARPRALGPAVAVVLAIAAALVLWLGSSIPPAEGPPAYAFTQRDGGIAELRGDASEAVAPLLFPDSEIDWVVTPERRVTTDVAAALLIEPVDGEPRILRLPAAEISASGAVRLRGPLHMFAPLTPGRYALTVVVGPPPALPHTAAAARVNTPTRWSAAVTEIVVATRRARNTHSKESSGTP